MWLSLLLAAGYMGYLAIRAILNPSLVPDEDYAVDCTVDCVVRRAVFEHGGLDIDNLAQRRGPGPVAHQGGGHHRWAGLGQGPQESLLGHTPGRQIEQRQPSADPGVVVVEGLPGEPEEPWGVDQSRGLELVLVRRQQTRKIP